MNVMNKCASIQCIGVIFLWALTFWKWNFMSIVSIRTTKILFDSQFFFQKILFGSGVLFYFKFTCKNALSAIFCCHVTYNKKFVETLGKTLLVGKIIDEIKIRRRKQFSEIVLEELRVRACVCRGDEQWLINPKSTRGALYKVSAYSKFWCNFERKSSIGSYSLQIKIQTNWRKGQWMLLDETTIYEAQKAYMYNCTLRRKH